MSETIDKPTHATLEALRTFLSASGTSTFAGGLRLLTSEELSRTFHGGTDAVADLEPLAYGLEHLYLVAPDGSVLALGEDVVTVASSVDEFLSLAACGFADPADPTTWEDDCHSADEPSGFLEWLEIELGVQPAQDPQALLNNARSQNTVSQQRVRTRFAEATNAWLDRQSTRQTAMQQAREKARKSWPSETEIDALLVRAARTVERRGWPGSVDRLGPGTSRWKYASFPIGPDEERVIWLYEWCTALSWHRARVDPDIERQREVLGTALTARVATHPMLVDAVRRLEYTEGLDTLRRVLGDDHEALVYLREVLRTRPTNAVVEKANDWSNL